MQLSGQAPRLSGPLETFWIEGVIPFPLACLVEKVTTMLYGVNKKYNIVVDAL